MVALPTVSLVIPSCGRTDLLRACLRSVAVHAPPGLEVLVVDDGSPDSAASRTAAEHPGVRSIRHATSLGFCASANAGIRATTGEIVELLNDDTEVTAGWVEAAASHFRNSQIGAVAPLVLRMMGSPPVIDSAGDRYFVGGVAGKRGHGEEMGPSWSIARRVFGASASSAFYRRSALTAVGAFPECFHAYFEDVDLSFRLNRAGYVIQYEPASRVYHHTGSSYRTPSRQFLEQVSRNEESVFWRNLPIGALATALPLHAAVLVGKAWRRWHEGRLSPFVWGRLRVLFELPALLAHRRLLASQWPEADPFDWRMDEGWLSIDECATNETRAGSVSDDAREELRR